MPRQPNPQNRLACDRCHGQKLRCPRQEGQGACQRCLRANATCIFSPRQKRTSPSTTKEKQHEPAKPHHQPAAPNADSDPDPAAHQPQPDIDLDLINSDILFSTGQPDVSLTTTHHACELPNDLITDTDSALPTDWSTFLGLATPAVSPWEYAIQPQSPSSQFRTTLFPDPIDQEMNSTDSSPSPSADTPSSSSTADSVDGNTTPNSGFSKGLTLHSHIRRLADLAVKLYDQYNMLPPVCEVVTEKLVLDCLETEEMASRLVAIDDIFKLTQSLIDIMMDFYPPDGKTAVVTPDQGTLLLLFSCTDRVLDIFEVLFAHMKACLSNDFIPSMPDGRPWHLPALRIGSYTPPAPTAIAMHMLTIILMASHLFDQLQEVLGFGRHGLAAASEGKTGGSGAAHPIVMANHSSFETDLAVGVRSKFPSFTEEAKAAVARRARSVAADIITSRRLVLNLPGMYGSGSFGIFTEAAVAKD